jgi:hypothetical protein
MGMHRHQGVEAAVAGDVIRDESVGNTWVSEIRRLPGNAHERRRFGIGTPRLLFVVRRPAGGGDFPTGMV